MNNPLKINHTNKTITYSRKNVRETNLKDLNYINLTDSSLESINKLLKKGYELFIECTQYKTSYKKQKNEPLNLYIIEVKGLKKLGLRARTTRNTFYRVKINIANIEIRAIKFNLECIHAIEEEIELLKPFKKIKKLIKFFRRYDTDNLYLPWTYSVYDLEEYKTVKEYIHHLKSELKKYKRRITFLREVN
ncbi:MAG: hypothetical protein U9N59_05245 [Campylobacterota bacterium]|nr:hypothetical protein [Campylobacterota bacterium]